MDRAGDQLLAGSRLTEDQHRGIGGGDLFDLLQHGEQCRARAEYAVELT